MVGEVREKWRAWGRGRGRGGARRHDAGEGRERRGINARGWCVIPGGDKGALQMPWRCSGQVYTWWRRTCELARRRPLTPLDGRLQGLGPASTRSSSTAVAKLNFNPSH